MRKSVLVLGLVVILLAAAAIYYYNGAVSVSHFSNGNISFDYPSSYSVDKTPVGGENADGYFLCALTSSSHTSAIVIYEIPRNTTKNVTANQTGNTTNSSTGNNSTNNTTVITNRTIQVTVDNLQTYLDQMSMRGGNPQKVLKNNYTYYVSNGLKTALVNYNSSSRTGNITYLTIDETAIVKDGFFNFYVVELLNGDNTKDATNVYNQIINTLRIIGT
jgi:hypothetical protein